MFTFLPELSKEPIMSSLDHFIMPASIDGIEGSIA